MTYESCSNLLILKILELMRNGKPFQGLEKFSNQGFLCADYCDFGAALVGSGSAAGSAVTAAGFGRGTISANVPPKP